LALSRNVRQATGKLGALSGNFAGKPQLSNEIRKTMARGYQGIAMRLAVWRTAAVIGAAGLAGCFGGGDGVNLVPVTGTVTLDSQPLAGAKVTFYPASGRLSAGTTDANGRYALQYAEDRPGALPGPHTVKISILSEPDPDSSDRRRKGPQETLPLIYNTRTNLKVEILPDHSEPIDFHLESQGAKRSTAR
jgi:hypothetical protein